MGERGQNLSGKVCLVTGASRGIGRAIAETFAAAGAIVYANARRAGCLDDWCAECTQRLPGEIVPCYFDVTDAGAAKEGLSTLWKERRRYDVLVNNAGLVSYEPLGMIDLAGFTRMLEVNVVATLNLIQMSARLMGRQKSGSIVNISSVVAVKGVAGQVAYSATKGAVNALTVSAAKELAAKGIRVNAVAPGMVATERLEKVAGERFSSKVEAIPSGRMALPVEVAEAVSYFASDASAYTTGQILSVDGGIQL